MNQAQLEKVTGIGHSTMSGYWSNRLALGLQNGAKIADALGVTIEELGLRRDDAFSPQRDLQTELRDLREVVEDAAERIGALEAMTSGEADEPDAQEDRRVS